jgi:hypothetical protein
MNMAENTVKHMDCTTSLSVAASWLDHYGEGILPREPDGMLWLEVWLDWRVSVQSLWLFGQEDGLVGGIWGVIL